MARLFAAFFVLLSCFCGVKNAHAVWPKPAYMKVGGVARIEVSSFNVTDPGHVLAGDLLGAFQRAKSNIFTHGTGSDYGRRASATAQLVVKVHDPSAELQAGVDESYELSIESVDEVQPPVISLTSKTQFGLYHALETLSQLIVYDFDAEAYVVTPVQIKDEPRFQHRGLLVDSSRHFQPVASLEAVIDSMAYAKLNVLHWHLIDTQSFPFDSPSYPLLGSKGAFSPVERYTAGDLAHIKKYAKARGVRVMAELDMPGHAGSWCKGHPEICPDPACPEPLNVAKNETFEVVGGILNDLTDIFDENMIHLGGDEVDTSCWESSNEISKWLTDNHMTTDEAYSYFIARVQKIAQSHGKSVIGWEEIWKHFKTDLDPSTIIHQWLPGSTVGPEVTAAGYRLIWSTYESW